MVITRRIGVLAVALAAVMPRTAILAHEGHGDHVAHHGGIVKPVGDMHCETVLLPQGGVRVYYADEHQHDVPASAVSDLQVQIERGDRSLEEVSMAISASGDFWEGKAAPIADGKGVVHLAFVTQEKPVVLDLAVAELIAAQKAAAADDDDDDDDHDHAPAKQASHAH